MIDSASMKQYAMKKSAGSKKATPKTKKTSKKKPC